MDYIPWIEGLDYLSLGDMHSRDYETLKRHLAHNLRQLRKDAGLSQERLSLDAQLDRSYVSQIERCVGNPSVLVLATLASTLGCDLVDLFAPPV